MSRKAAQDFFDRISGDIELKKALRLLLQDKSTEELMPALVGFSQRLGFYFKVEEFVRVLWSKVEVPPEEKPDPYAHVLRGFFHHYAPAKSRKKLSDKTVPLLAENSNREQKVQNAANVPPALEEKGATVAEEEEQGL